MSNLKPPSPNAPSPEPAKEPKIKGSESSGGDQEGHPQNYVPYLEQGVDFVASPTTRPRNLVESSEAFVKALEKHRVREAQGLEAVEQDIKRRPQNS